MSLATKSDFVVPKSSDTQGRVRSDAATSTSPSPLKSATATLWVSLPLAQSPLVIPVVLGMPMRLPNALFPVL
jgi:hypothetical protein